MTLEPESTFLILALLHSHGSLQLQDSFFMWVQEEFIFSLVLAVRQTFSSLMTVPFFNRNNDIKK